MDTPNRTALRIQAEGNSPVPPRLMGRSFHGAMSNETAHLDSAGGSQNKAPEEEWLSCWFNLRNKLLKDNFKVTLLSAIMEVPLWGFMYPKNEDFLSDLNYWNGRADAIGLLEGEDDYKYVIIDWKSASKLDHFWINKPCGDYFTQCFVYARLLKLHLSLDYYPPILIVPFNSEREYMHPRLFTDYPDQFKEAIEKYQWSTNPPQRFKKESPLKDKVKEGRVTVTALTFHWWGSNYILFYFYSLYHVFTILHLPISLSMPFASTFCVQMIFIMISSHKKSSLILCTVKAFAAHFCFSAFISHMWCTSYFIFHHCSYRLLR